VVIGGGVAGLTAVKVCQDHGIDAHAFERDTALGGVWNYTYKNVRLQQHKDDFRLSGTEWPAGVADFPDAKAVEEYIAKFVCEHNLAPKVENPSPYTPTPLDAWTPTFIHYTQSTPLNSYPLSL
jgi:cation diffusion facilitator CzcD-associated flavoprotein CzcO